MARIAFLDQKNQYDGETVRAIATRGTQHGTASLAEAFASLQHEVTVYNLTPEDKYYNGVCWSNINAAKNIQADLIISNNRANTFDKVQSGKKVLWSRNPITVRRLFKQKNLFPIYRHRPHIVFLGNHHANSVTGLLPFSTRHVIPHALSNDFRREKASVSAPPARAIFVSHPSRNLEWVVAAWSEFVHSAVPSAELHVFAGDWNKISKENWKSVGIVNRERVPRKQLAEEMMSARIMLYPGHKEETFCFAAAEATAVGLPVVTRGIGSLADRVCHGENGFVAQEAKAFSDHAIRLLTDDDVWLDIHQKTLASHDPSTWEDRAHQWVQAFL